MTRKLDNLIKERNNVSLPLIKKVGHKHCQKCTGEFSRYLACESAITLFNTVGPYVCSKYPKAMVLFPKLPLATFT